MYLKSHKNYGPGQQVKRDYHWPVDATSFRFGKVDRESENISQIMKPDALEEGFPLTKVLTKNQMDHAKFMDDHLGKPANLGQTNPYVGTDMTYGKPLEKS